MKILITSLLTLLFFFANGQGCTITASNLVEISGDDGSGNCLYSIDILFVEGNGPDNGTLTFTSPTATILTGAGPHSCACSGNTYTLTFQVTCGSTVSFTAFHDNSGNGNDCTVTVTNIALAVEWLDFFVEIVDKDVVLIQWSTAQEINNEVFEVEYSVDGHSFEYLSTISGSGTTFRQSDYQYRHIHSHQGVLYYRIKQIDFDGHFSYSDIKQVSLDHNNSYSIFPNPAKETLYISGIDEEALIHVVDILGNKKFSTSNSSIDLSNLANGLYTVIVEKSGMRFSQQFLVMN